MNCYNGEQYLQEALDSILAQTYNNWELIFWDNQSTDKSADIFLSYHDSRLKYFYAPQHTNLGKARNLAIEKTKGQWLAFLDVDDWWLPKKLEKQIPLFDDHDVGLVYGNAWEFFEKKNKKIIYKKESLPKGRILNELMREYAISSATYVIRKKSLESLEYYFNDNFHIIGDFDINLRLAVKWKINCLQEPVAYIRKHDKNLSLLYREKEVDELKIWHEEMKNNKQISSQSNFNKVLLIANYLEAMQMIMKSEFFKSLIIVAKYPFCFNKIKLMLALLLPKFLLKKIKNY